ncbi:corrinoid protein [Clostridia bacterium]|nr:corrinoid protein [Clostridia bacterium]
MYLEEIVRAVQNGKAAAVKEQVQKAIEEGVSAREILNDGLLSAMSVIGDKFTKNKIYVPEVLLAARATNVGIALLQPLFAEENIKPLGKVVIGTVQGDIHDIGKNLVGMLMKGIGFEVHDIGVDIAPLQFVKEAQKIGADIVCISSLLTTSMINMKWVIDEFEIRGIRDKHLIMVGGALVTSQFAKQIGADLFSAEAGAAARLARKQLIERNS